MKKTDTPQHLLAVDDDVLALEFLSQGLTAAGYRVTIAHSGEEALERARTLRFDLALVDMHMPGISGAEVVRQLLASHGCFSLILSGRNDAESVRAAAGDGALGYLVKPLEVANLIPSIETSLARCEEMSRLARSHGHLNTALQEGRETSMAVGVLMERMRLDRDTAFALVRDSARLRRQRVAHVAAEIVRAAELLNHLGGPSVRG